MGHEQRQTLNRDTKIVKKLRDKISYASKFMANGSCYRKVWDILLVSSDVRDIRVVHESLVKAKITYNLVIFDRPRKAIEYVRAERGADNVIIPDMIFVSGRDGDDDIKDVVNTIKGDSALSWIPVVYATEGPCKDKSLMDRVNAVISRPISTESVMLAIKSVNPICFLSGSGIMEAVK